MEEARIRQIVREELTTLLKECGIEVPDTVRFRLEAQSRSVRALASDTVPQVQTSSLIRRRYQE